MIPDPNDPIAAAKGHLANAVRLAAEARRHANDARRHADDAVRYADKAQRWAWAALACSVFAFVWNLVRAVL